LLTQVDGGLGVAVVLDTSDIALADRTDALITAMHEASVPSYVIPEDTRGTVDARLDVWSYGVASIFRASMSGIQLVRTARQARAAPSPDLALAVQESADGVLAQGGTTRVFGPGQMHTTDLNSAYDFKWSGNGASRCLYVPLELLGLPDQVVQEASLHLEVSPLYQLVSDHINALTDRADELSSDHAAAELGTATVELVRALLASAAHDRRYAAGALSQTLLTQIRDYVRRHLSDPRLGPEEVAAAHNISTRYLYKVCSTADFSLEQWIIGQRLHGARDELTRPAANQSSIAAISRRWGFVSPTHFSRRFHAAYGITPRDWRRISTAQL
jgi:AraC-like DNA-binding protein